MLAGPILALMFIMFSKFQAEGSNPTETASQKPKVKAEIAREYPAKSVCLDPGHGGEDMGATNGKISEAEINLKVAKIVQAELQGKYQVFMTREDDSFLAKRARANYCNSVYADILVSIHHNSYKQDRSVNYSTVLYYKDEDQLLASSLLSSTSKKLKTENKGVAKFNNSLLWVAKMPAVLTEAFFITSTREYQDITNQNSARLRDEATSIAEGIVRYFENPSQIEISSTNDALVIDRTDSDD